MFKQKAEQVGGTKDRPQESYSYQGVNLDDDAELDDEETQGL